MDGEAVYETDNQLPGVFPPNATLYIPGDEFPTVAAHSLFEPSPPVRVLPDAALPVTPDSSYSWIPGDDQTYMQISLLGYSETDEFQGFAVSCWVEDDGAFDLPEEVINYLATTELRMQVRYTRRYVRLDLYDGIVFVQKVSVAE